MSKKVNGLQVYTGVTCIGGLNPEVIINFGPKPIETTSGAATFSEAMDMFRQQLTDFVKKLTR